MIAMNDPARTDPMPGSDLPAAAPVLPYATPMFGHLVKLASFGTADEAELNAAELAAEGIRGQVFNAKVNALGLPYTGFTDVELHVAAEDVERAAAVLARNADDLEPQEPQSSDAPQFDQRGKPMRLVTAAAFDNVRLLRDAHTILSAARLRCFLPTLVPRGNAPPGQGNRFILRIAEEDADQARALLNDADAGDDEPRCPHCKSSRIYPVGHFWKNVAAQVGLAPKPPNEMECLACRHRGATEEFTPAGKAGL